MFTLAGLIVGIVSILIALGSLWVAKRSNDKADKSNTIAEGSDEIAERALKVAEEALAFQEESAEEIGKTEVSVTIEPVKPGDERILDLLLTATNTGGQKVYLKRVVLEADGVEISQQDFKFIHPGLTENTYIEPHQHNEQKVLAMHLKPAIQRQTGKKTGIVTITGCFIDGEGKRWPANSSVSFDLDKAYSILISPPQTG